ncbi:MAG TPA: AI-2E family transporter [Acidimicrobiales bacterium]
MDHDVGNPDDARDREEPDAPLVHPALRRAAAYSWRLIVVGFVVYGVLWLLDRLQLVLIPVVIALFLSRALAPVNAWLWRRRWPKGLASAVTMLGFFAVLGGITAAITPALADEIDSLRPTVTEALDDVENWLVEESPFDISRESIDRFRARTGERVDNFFDDADGEVLDSATLAAEIIAAAILALILTFFMLRDGPRFVDWTLRHAPARHQPALRRAADRGWTTLGAYLRGAAVLGVVEAITIGLTLWLAGGRLVVPVMVVTFMAAFIPIIGAIAAGVLAVMVGLVTGGVVTALIVGIVALIVQQVDNDILAPYIYGRALNLHPVVVLLSVAGGGALFGIPGTLLAVPVVAVAVNIADELRSGEGTTRRRDSTD